MDWLYAQPGLIRSGLMGGVILSALLQIVGYTMIFREKRRKQAPNKKGRPVVRAAK